MSLGQFLKSLRKSKKLTQSQFSEVCGLSKNRIITLEQSEAPYSVDKLAKYCGAMGFEVEISFVDKEDKSKVYVFKPAKTTLK